MRRANMGWFQIFTAIVMIFTGVYHCRAASLPVITVSPASKTVVPGVDATLSVTATGATSYQWTFNGTNLPGATGSVLTVTNPQSANSGYYYALAINSAGLVPSDMAYLSVVSTSGRVPFANSYFTNSQMYYVTNSRAMYSENCISVADTPINGATAQLIAGPALDQMAPISGTVAVANGFFTAGGKLVPSVAPGQDAYCRVMITYATPCTLTQLSTVLKLTAVSSTTATPWSTNIGFITYVEYPDPWQSDYPYLSGGGANQYYTRFAGESLTWTQSYHGYVVYGGGPPAPTGRWRKGGAYTGAVQPGTAPFGFYQLEITNTLSNIQPSDAGVYDVEVHGNNWFIGPRVFLTVKLNGGGTFQNVHRTGTNLISDLVAEPGRNYAIQASTNLTSWADISTVSNVTGTMTLTNPLPKIGSTYYRARLIPLP